jgi:hypothetical protein
MNATYKLNTTGPTMNVIGWGSISTGTYSGMLHDPKVGFWGFNADVKSSVTADANYGHRVTLIVNGSTTTVYTDNTSTGSGSPTLNTTSNTALSLGCSTGSSNYLNGNLAEVLLFNTALGSTERTLVETAQSTYYGQ